MNQIGWSFNQNDSRTPKGTVLAAEKPFQRLHFWFKACFIFIFCPWCNISQIQYHKHQMKRLSSQWAGQFLSVYKTIRSFIGLQTKYILYTLWGLLSILHESASIIQYQEVRQRHVCITRRSRIYVFRRVSEVGWLPTPFYFLPTPLHFLPTSFSKFSDFLPTPRLFTYPLFQNFTYPNHFLPTPMICLYLPPLPTPYLPPWGVGGVGKKKSTIADLQV